MLSLASHQTTPNILSLFDFTRPTMPRAFNVLEGITRGEVYVDDPVHPRWGVVHEVVYDTLYFGGEVNAELVHSIVGRIHQTRDVGIGCWLDDPLNNMLPQNPDYDGRTLYFTERSSSRPTSSLPSEYKLASRDRDLLKQSFDYEATLASFGTEENVIKNTLGVEILYEDKVVCEAATGAPARNWIEVGVTTDQAHRERGLATIACTRLIELCEAKGFTTWWDCAKQNIPSIRLAYKLGYRNEREYRYVWWAKEMA